MPASASCPEGEPGPALPRPTGQLRPPKLQKPGQEAPQGQLYQVGSNGNGCNSSERGLRLDERNAFSSLKAERYSKVVAKESCEVCFSGAAHKGESAQPCQWSPAPGVRARRAGSSGYHLHARQAPLQLSHFHLLLLRSVLCSLQGHTTLLCLSLILAECDLRHKRGMCVVRGRKRASVGKNLRKEPRSLGVAMAGGGSSAKHTSVSHHHAGTTQVTSRSTPRPRRTGTKWAGLHLRATRGTHGTTRQWLTSTCPRVLQDAPG